MPPAKESVQVAVPPMRNGRSARLEDRMRWMTVAFATTALAVGIGVAIAGGKDEPKPSVKYARSWEAAIEEAKALNVPMVVHSHGFY